MLGEPYVTLLQPTMIMAVVAKLPTTRAAIRRRLGHSQPLTTVCRRYRVRSAIAGSFQSAPPPVRLVQDWRKMEAPGTRGDKVTAKVRSAENIRADHVEHIYRLTRSGN